jgi:hypothetical protein
MKDRGQGSQTETNNVLTHECVVVFQVFACGAKGSSPSPAEGLSLSVCWNKPTADRSNGEKAHKFVNGHMYVGAT